MSFVGSDTLGQLSPPFSREVFVLCFLPLLGYNLRKLWRYSDGRVQHPLRALAAVGRCIAKTFRDDTRFRGDDEKLRLQRGTSRQRKNSTFASRNQTVLGGAAEIGPLMPKTAS
jgi:hypothetical protein